MADTSNAENSAAANTTEQVAESSSSQPPKEEPKCASCGKSPETLKPCIKCHSVSYCNRDCVKADFKKHKKACPLLAQEYIKTHEPKMASRATPKSNDRNTGYQKWQFDT